jgi:WD40 repeat protein
MATARRIRTWLPAVALSAGSLTCGGDLAEPPPPQPATLESLGGDGQIGLVGRPLPESLVVRVKDAAGRPFAGAVVSWSGGALSSTSVTSASNGQAAVQWVLGTTPGAQATTASISGLPSVTFTAMAEAETEPVRRLAISAEPSSAAESGISLPDQPVLRVEDGEGKPLGSGIPVTASVEGATLTGTMVAESDPSGVARFSDLILSGHVGSYSLTFSAPDIPAVHSRSIELKAGAVGVMIVLTQPPASVLDQEVFAPDQQPVVQVTDAQENPVEGITVTASLESSTGRLEGRRTATTGSDGEARFLDLGIAGSGESTVRFSSGPVAVSTIQIGVQPLSAAATSGQWGPVIDWAANGADIVPVHLTLLPTGKLLAWGRAGQPWTWTPPADGDPSAPGLFREFPVDTMLFCAGHALLADGRLLVSGGHLDDDRGLEVTHIFDPYAERWTGKGELPNMARGRWYPTVTVLPDGRAVTVAGRDTASAAVGVPELWDGRQWVLLQGAAKQFPYYPKDFVAPDGRVFYAGERVQSWWLDVDAVGTEGRGRWTAGPNHVWPFNRDYGTAVMYRPGRILYAGGGGDPASNQPRDATAPAPTNTAEIIDLNSPSPAWSSTGSMQFSRRHLNATILPDGQVLVTGGVSGAGFNSFTTGVHQAELWDPETGRWTTLAANAVNRAYHSVSLLLPNGEVLHGASGDARAPREPSHEIFLPPYLFRGNRPAITRAPSTVGYGMRFAVQTSYAAQITGANLIRLGSVTHTFDQNARFVPLSFRADSGVIRLTAPSNPNLAPPGHYLLFLVNRNGVPSEGRIVQLH